MSYSLGHRVPHIIIYSNVVNNNNDAKLGMVCRQHDKLLFVHTFEPIIIISIIIIDNWQN